MVDSGGVAGKESRHDRFRGGDALLRLSQRLMDWYDEPVTDDEVAEAIGAELVPAFRYAERGLAGKVRKVTLEPAFCHSADVAFRALGLGYPNSTLMACFLHDVVEDTSGTIGDVPAALADLAAHFPADVVEEVDLLTNRFQLIFDELVPKVRRDVPFEPRTGRAFRAALDVLRYELPAALEARFERELDQLGTFFEGDLDWAIGIKIARRDKRFAVATYLKRQVYRLYVADLATGAEASTRASDARGPVTALVVKLLDLTDNIRTTEVSNRLSLYKLITKAETLLDIVQRDFLDPLPSELAERTTLPELHRMVQLRLVNQFEVRRRAVADNFSETRFASLVDFLGQQTARLIAKYDLPEERIGAIEVLEDTIRATNGG